MLVIMLVIITLDICPESPNQFNVLIRLKPLLGNVERLILINSFVLANFNFCPLIWMFVNTKPVHKIEVIQKRALSFMINNYESSYEDLLKRLGKPGQYASRTVGQCA